MNEKPGKDRKPAIPSFSDFMTGLDLAVKYAAEKRRSSGVLTFLRRKASFSFTQEQGELIRGQLRMLPDYGAVEFSVFVESCLNPRPSRAVSALGAEIGKNYRTETKFLEYCGNESGQRGLSPCVAKWAAYLTETPRSERTSTSSRWPDSGIIRAAFGCLLTRREADDFLESTLHLLTCFFPLVGGGQSHSAGLQLSTRFARAVFGLLKPRNPKKGHIQLLLLTAEVLQERLQQAVSGLNRARLDLESLEADFKAKTEEISSLREEVTNNQKTIGNLQAEMTQLEATLLQEKGKNEALDKHWQVVLQQEMAGLSARLRRQLEHEVSEIQLCLTGNSPNVEMASHRIARVAEIIAGLKGE